MLNESEQMGNRGRVAEALLRIDEANRIIEENCDGGDSGEIEVQLRAQAD